MLGQNRLRVKLNSKDRMLGVLDRHDRSVVGPGRRPQDRRQTRRIDRQGMVPADLKFLRQSLEQSIAHRVKERNLDGLLEQVNRALTLIGDRADLVALQQQITERNTRFTKLKHRNTRL